MATVPAGPVSVIKANPTPVTGTARAHATTNPCGKSATEVAPKPIEDKISATRSAATGNPPHSSIDGPDDEARAIPFKVAASRTVPTGVTTTTAGLLTGSEASDSRHFETLLDIGPDITPRAALGDKGYDTRANRQAARVRGICPAIPYKVTAVNRPVFFPKALYKARARIEQTVGKLKRFKRVALRCEKTAQHYGSLVALALGFIIAKSVHTA